MKIFVYLMSALMLVATAEAKKKKGGNNKQNQKRQQEKQQAKKERDDRRDAINEVLDDKDTNNDGSVSKDEFLAGESNQEAAAKRFDEANKNGDRNLTKSEIAKMLGVD